MKDRLLSEELERDKMAIQHEEKQEKDIIIIKACWQHGFV